MDLSALIYKMIIFAVLLIIGYIMARKELLTPAFSKDASALLMNVFIVASIINSVIGEQPELSRAQFFMALGMTSLTMLITYIASYLFCLPIRKEESAAQTEMMLDATNTLFVGMPIISSLYVGVGTFYIGMSCISYNLLLYSYGIWRLRKKDGDGKMHFADVISLPLAAAVISLALFFLEFPMPQIVKEFISTVSGGTVPLSMIIIGASLGNANPASAFREKRNYLISLERLILVPVLTYFIVGLFTDDSELLLTCTVLGGVPIGAIATPLSIKYGYDASYAARATMVTTILCMITIPVLIKILFG